MAFSGFISKRTPEKGRKTLYHFLVFFLWVYIQSIQEPMENMIHVLIFEVFKGYSQTSSTFAIAIFLTIQKRHLSETAEQELWRGPLIAYCTLAAFFFKSKALETVTEIFWIQWMEGLLGWCLLYLPEFQRTSRK